jgi:hypothetical protein
MSIVRAFEDRPVRDSAVMICGKVESYILSFSDFQEGWCSGSGLPISSKAINEAMKIYQEMKKYYYYEVEVFPTESGGIILTFSQSARFMDVVLNGTGDAEIFLEYDTIRTLPEKKLGKYPMPSVCNIILEFLSGISRTYNTRSDTRNSYNTIGNAVYDSSLED